MAGNTATLVVKIIGDSSGATRALAQVDAATGRSAGNTAKAGKSMAGVWTAVAAAMAGCAKAASDLEQATGAVTQIFGEQSAEIMAWAEGMAAYGLSTAQAAQAAAVMGAQMKNLGIPMEYVAQLSTGLIELGADLAAVMGGTVPEAVMALGAALRGEYDSLERYGITLSAATVETEAQRLAAEGLTFASENQAKAVATLSLIWQQCADVQGAAAQEANTLQASMGQLRAAVTNLAAEVGQVLIPILVPLIQTITDVITKITEAISESELLQLAFDVLAAAGEAVGQILDALSPLLETLADLLGKVSDIIERTLVPVLEALGGALDVVADALSTVIGWVEDAINAFQRLIDTIHEAIDSLTFWNDSYQASAVPSSMAITTGATSRSRPATQAPAIYNIHVSGAIDPEATARQIRNILARSDKRRGIAALAAAR